MIQSETGLDLVPAGAQPVRDTVRYSIFFEPGTYGSASSPLDFQVGFYTQVAGLGADAGDVVINGAINVFNRQAPTAHSARAPTNFWRSISNLTLNVALPSSALRPTRRSPVKPTPALQQQRDLLALSQADSGPPG